MRIQLWLNSSATSQEGPWQQAQHFVAALTKGSSDASSVAWGGVVKMASGTFPAGGGVPTGLVVEAYQPEEDVCPRPSPSAILHATPGRVRRAQVLIHVDNQSVVDAFNRGRAKNRETHALLVRLFELQLAYGFMLSLKWIPAAGNEVADAISAVTRRHHSHRAGIGSSGLGRDGPF